MSGTRLQSAASLNVPPDRGDGSDYKSVAVKRSHASGEMLRIAPPRSVVSRTRMLPATSAASTQLPPPVPE
jgi:hypothetical protein